MRILGIVGGLSLACVCFASIGVTRVEVANDTYLIIEQRVISGMIEHSVHTTLAIEWPNSFFRDKIGRVSYYNGNEDLQLVTVASHHLVIYGSSVYYRPLKGGAWAGWIARNSDYSPPRESVAAYLHDWFRFHGQLQFEYVPYVENATEEQISFRMSPDKPVILFGSRTHWTLPYRFSSADVASNSLRWETTAPGLPRFLVFVGPPRHFGAWFFDFEATTKANQ